MMLQAFLFGVSILLIFLLQFLLAILRSLGEGFLRSIRESIADIAGTIDKRWSGNRYRFAYGCYILLFHAS